MDFNPHSRKGSDGRNNVVYQFPRDFNPHSRKGSDWKHCREESEEENFNPHSRKGSDRWRKVHGYFSAISIHTPARGVTMSPVSFQNHLIISIHTPARGVTAKMHIKASSLLLHFYIFYTNIYCISIASQTKN